MRHTITPLGAVTRGLLAGAAGSAAQNLFFKATANITPKTPEGVFEPPEPRQKEESSLQTVARRTVEDLMQRGPLDEEAKARTGQLVHYSFGAMWGVDYALARESFPWLSSPGGVALWSTSVWAWSDNVILPVFRLAAWPHRYPVKVHLHALAAHLVYGAAVWATYETLRPRVWSLARGAALGAALWWKLRRAPKPLRPKLSRSVKRGSRLGATVSSLGAGLEAARA